MSVHDFEKEGKIPPLEERELAVFFESDPPGGRKLLVVVLLIESEKLAETFPLMEKALLIFFWMTSILSLSSMMKRFVLRK